MSAALLDELRAAVTRYVAMPGPEDSAAVALWIAASHAQPAMPSAPRLIITAPVKGCGKSRLLDVVEATCHQPLIAVSISAAALVRMVGADDPPTVLVDESDTIFGPKSGDNHEDLRGILNAGFGRNRPYIRWNAAARAPETCPTFAMAALAGISNGCMPDTVLSRAVVISLRRRAPAEVIAPWRDHRDPVALRVLAGQVCRWLRPHMSELRAAEPWLPVEDRPADVWAPLAAVADLAGGDWPALARSACKVLTDRQAADDTEASQGLRLLSDLRDIFGWAGWPLAMFGDALLSQLRAIPEAPWGDWDYRPFSQRDLARLLRPYGVRPTTVKIAGEHRKGYRRDDLSDPWARYLPALPGAPSVTAVTSVTSEVSQVTDGIPRSVTSVTPSAGVTAGHAQPGPSVTPLVSKVTEVTEVTANHPSRESEALS